MKIITVSREFGSGGGELGKRLADVLSVPCYDHEIIDMVAEKCGYDKNYVACVSEKDIRTFFPQPSVIVSLHRTLQRSSL